MRENKFMIKVIIEAIRQYRIRKKEALRRKHMQLDEEAIRNFIREEVKAEFLRHNIVTTNKTDKPLTYRELYIKNMTGDK